MFRRLWLLCLLLLLFSCWVTLIVGDGRDDKLSDHMVFERHLTDVVLVANAQTTEGPFFEAESDFRNTTDMLSGARVGAPGITTTPRTTVLNGIRFNLTLRFVRVTTSGTVKGPLRGASVFLWHTDSIGVYSAVPELNTNGQKWLRSRQATNVNGIVRFRTILPGWYPGRCIHWHVRVQLANSVSYVATSQLFISDALLNAYRTVRPYSTNSQRITYLANDFIYSSLNSAVASKLVLQPQGTNVKGYTANITFGIVA